MSLVRNLALGFIAAVGVAWGIEGPARAQGDISTMKVALGEKLLVAAESGTTQDILGHGYTKDLSSVQPDGRASRVYPAKYKETPVKQYSAELELIENSLQFDANARILFANAGIKTDSSRRYVVMRVSYVDKIASLLPEGEPLADTDLYVSKVYYGWALYIVIEGSKNDFTTDVAAKLGTVGVDIVQTAKNHHLRTHIHAIGLQPKEARGVVIATNAKEVAEAFETPEVPVPIYVEYRTRKELEVVSLEWDSPRLKPGQYRVDVSFEVMSSKSDGRPWDGGGGPPDPLVILFDGDSQLTSCKVQDSFVSTCLNGKIIDVHESSRIGLYVIDKDLAADDDIGAAGYVQPVGNAELRKPILLRTSGQLKRASITFSPVH